MKVAWLNYCAMVLDEEYLASRISRRTSWRWVLPIAALGFPLLGYFYQNMLLPGPHYAIGLSMVGYLFASRMCTSSLLPDVVVVSSFILTVHYTPDAYYHTALITGVPFGVLAFASIGVNSFAVFTYAVVMSVFAVTDSRATPDDVVFVPAFIFVASLCSLLHLCGIIGEYCSASLFSDLQDQLEATSRLLDSTTNGCCIVDSSNGNIFSKSARLSETLGSSQLLGAHLSDFVHHDDKAALERLYDTNRKLYPLLVTCWRTPRTSGGQAVSFDAKITPYFRSGSLLHICFQVQGELREEAGGKQSSTEEASSESKDSKKDK